MSMFIELAIEQWRSMRAEFSDYHEAAYARAERETNGVLLNQRGKRAGIDPFSLFIGTDARARAYASDELLEHWERFPRITYAQFERERIELPPQELITAHHGRAS